MLGLAPVRNTGSMLLGIVKKKEIKLLPLRFHVAASTAQQA